MSAPTGIHETIGSGLKLCGEIADSMGALRARVDEGGYDRLGELFDIQSRLADDLDRIAGDIAARNMSGDMTDADRLLAGTFRDEVAHAIEATMAAVDSIAAEKEHAALKLRTLQDGKRAIQSYARMSGR